MRSSSLLYFRSSSLNLADTLLLGDAVTRDCYSITVSQQDLIPPFPHSHTHPREPYYSPSPQFFFEDISEKVLKNTTSYAQRTFNKIHHLHLHRKVIHRERHKQGNCQSGTHLTQLVLRFKFSQQKYYITLPYLPNFIQVAEHFRIKTFLGLDGLFLTWQELEGRLLVVFEGYGFLGWYLT